VCWSVGGSFIQYTSRCIFRHDGLQAAVEIAVGLADVGGQLVVPALGTRTDARQPDGRGESPGPSPATRSRYKSPAGSGLVNIPPCFQSRSPG
jgi:hypothetical protein